MALIFSLLFAIGSPAADLEIQVRGAEKGIILAALHNEAQGFPDSAKPFREARSSAEATSLRFVDLPAGRYAIAVFQDVNGNGKMDRDWLGIPSEPFGFSENPQIRFGAPGFDRCDFEFTGKSEKREIALIRF